MGFLLTILFGIVSFVIAVSLAVAGVKAQELTPLQRALVLFGAAALAVPGLMSVYMSLVLAAFLSD